MSLRVRSVLAAALATVLAVVVLGSAVDLLVARHLRRDLDHTLRARAVEVAQLSVSAPALLTTPGSLDSAVGGAQSMVEVLDRHDRIVARSLSLGGRVLPRQLAAAAIATGTGRFRSAAFDGSQVRVYAAPLADAAGPAAGGAVVVAASTDDVDDTIGATRALTAFAAIGAAIAGALAVAFGMRGALLPLVRLDRAAAEIERTGDPRRRLPGAERSDEVGRLATTLNAMLNSLEQARDAERRFLADASHELRTPLTSLRGNAAHLARHGANPELVADLQRDAERLARLADDLLALSREEAAPRPVDEVDLHELAQSATADEVGGDGDPVLVRADRAALERAIANLVENARLHGPAGGRVSIAVSHRDSLASLTVTDEGPGVDEAERELAFERFWRGRPADGGSGLGLAIVRATAERHGGRAFADGSGITIELPLIRKGSDSHGYFSGEDLEKGRP
jgi:two-component system OmpR family sensor kinase